MSRSNSANISSTAQTNSATDQTNAENAQNAENADIGNYESQLSKYAAENPYTSGGEYQTSQNQTMAANADVGSSALTNQLQTQAQRTGQNAGAANATAAEAARQNQRDLSAGEASDNATRIGNEAGYNQGVVNASEIPAQLEAGEASADLDAANNSLGTAQQASASSPSFWDEILQGSISAGQAAAGAAAGAAAKGAAGAAAKGCWIAAELYGGWNDPRTIDVRRWLFNDFVKSWYGWIICSLYEWQGERVAEWIHRWPMLRRVFLPLFNKALNKARGR